MSKEHTELSENPDESYWSDEGYVNTGIWIDNLKKRFGKTPWYKKTWWFIRRIIGKLYWGTRYRIDPSHRYHIVKTGLTPGYYDTDYRLEAAIITLFKKFVEREKPFECFDVDDPDTKAVWDRVKNLYEYFKDYDVNHPVYIQRDKGKDEEWSMDEYMEWHKKYERLHDELTEKLIEIIRLRYHFWT